ncbi:MAG: hypothetical protein K2H33_06030 [Muribaculaceae bacterium]|nr:hypothetical protein [Muribaculaceae bacterium]
MMTTTTFHFDGQRLSRRLMAESALRVAAGGDPADLLGSAEADALACVAGAALARVAVDLLPYSAGFDADSLTIDILLSPGADSLLAFRLAESAIAALLAGCESEATDLTGAAKRVLRGHAGSHRITPY